MISDCSDSAGKKIAVSNAHPELIEMADLVVESNDDDAVARYLIKRSLGE